MQKIEEFLNKRVHVEKNKNGQTLFYNGLLIDYSQMNNTITIHDRYVGPVTLSLLNLEIEPWRDLKNDK